MITRKQLLGLAVVGTSLLSSLAPRTRVEAALISPLSNSTVFIFNENLGYVANNLDNRVLFQDAETNAGPAVTVTGKTVENDLLVDITSNEGSNLFASADAQAKIEKSGGGVFQSISITMNPSSPMDYFSALKFLVNGQLGINFKIEIEGVNIALTDVTFAELPLVDGDNWFSLTTASSAKISKAILTASSEVLANVQQIRVVGANLDNVPGDPQAVPEPSSLALIGMLAIPGLGIYGRRRWIRSRSRSGVRSRSHASLVRQRASDESSAAGRLHL